MGLFDLLGNGGLDPYASQDQAQAAADHTAQAGGWHEPDPPILGRDFDPARDDDFTTGRW
jgi:hypothetical protein